MAILTWKYDAINTVVFNYGNFPVTVGPLQLDCSDDHSNTPRGDLDIPATTSGFLSILSIGFKYGNGPAFTCTLSDIGTGSIISTQNFLFGIPFGAPITEVPYGLELADHNDLTPDGYQDSNTVLRWNSVGYYDGIYGRPAQKGLGSNQRWYDGGYSTGKYQFGYLNPFLDSM
jgi:hypothetical protein